MNIMRNARDERAKVVEKSKPPLAEMAQATTTIDKKKKGNDNSKRKNKK